jgi:hypothetical protein
MESIIPIGTALTWFSMTLKDCCEIQYGYNINKCIGEAAAGSSKYYVDWATFRR